MPAYNFAAQVAAAQQGVAMLKSDHKTLDDLGLLEPGQPTRSAHNDHVRSMESEFTPLERRLIRNELFGSAQQGDS